MSRAGRPEGLPAPGILARAFPKRPEKPTLFAIGRLSHPPDGRPRCLMSFRFAFLGALAAVLPATAVEPGYFRQPAIHGDTVVFVAEGDLWSVPVAGGRAVRITTHPAAEGNPAISPDGKSLAFTARFEGPTEVYVMPLAGGRPRRLTFDAAKISHVGWTPDGKVLVGTDVYSGLPAQQLIALDISAADGTVTRTRIPLAQAADGSYSPDGKTLFFTRLSFQGSHTRRYQGGTAQQLWSYHDGDAEAKPLTANYDGTSKAPMAWNGRVYFASDRDGTMNLWSMKSDGTDPKQHTKHTGFNLASLSHDAGRVVYQLGADLHVLDIKTGTDKLVPIVLDSDFDQTREKWIKEPIDFMTNAHPSPDGSKVAVTARGRAFVIPRKDGRLVEVRRKPGVRYRDARFMPDGKSLLVLSDESGEVELWTVPTDGTGDPVRLTTDGVVLRRDAVPSPDGKYIAHTDKDQRLYLLNVETKVNKKLAETQSDEFNDLAWSPDSKWLAFAEEGNNQLHQVKLYGVASGKITPVTTDRFDSFSPAFSPDGKWLYLCSDRNFKSVVKSPWGTYQPEPFFDNKTRIYQLALVPDLRSPFTPLTELDPADKDEKDDKKPEKKEEKKEETKPEKKDEKKDNKKPAKKDEAKPEKKEETKPEKKDEAKPEKKDDKPIDLDGITTRLIPVPVPAGNYRGLVVTDSALFWMSLPSGADEDEDQKGTVKGMTIDREEHEVKTVADEAQEFELSADGKKLLIVREKSLLLTDAAPASVDVKKSQVDLAGWTFPVNPREEWRQMFADAWRMERDFFYDRGMHGLDWYSIRKRYEPLVDRVADRDELDDVMAQMVAELSALHVFVIPGDVRKGPDAVRPGHLGAALVRDAKAGGYRVERIFKHDPDEPDRASPLAKPGVNVKAGDVIVSIDGSPTLAATDVGELLRGKAHRQVLLEIKPANGERRKVIVKPSSGEEDRDLRYHEWEYGRRRMTDELGSGDIGYVHLRAMGGVDMETWAREYYPVFTKGGLVIDVRNNQGGNIDSWIIARLLRKAWSYWNQRVGRGSRWNMQFAFRGHIAVLCNEWTASDGEAFSEAIKQLKLGPVIGTRTWGGEIWLSMNNGLVDKGIASSPQFGVFNQKGSWLIEGRGVEPDIVIDNLPHATFKGEDAQLTAAVKYLKKKLKDEPVTLPPVPAFPKK
jgi:tricorn protease